MAESKIDILTALLKAFGEHDVDQAVSYMAPDVEWHYHVGTRPVIGRENVRKVLDKLGRHQRDSRWRPVRWAETGDTLLVEAIEDYLNPHEHRAQVPYMGAYDFDADNLITGWRDYFDLDLLMKSDRGEPMDVWVQALVATDRE